MRLFTSGFIEDYQGNSWAFSWDSWGFHQHGWGISENTRTLATTPSATIPKAISTGKALFQVRKYTQWVCLQCLLVIQKGYVWSLEYYTVYPSKFSNFKEGHNDKPINHWFLVSNFQRNLHSQLMCSDSIHSVSPLLGGQVVGVP